MGCPTTSFVFQLTYTDLDGDMPDTGYPKVYVYSDAAGTVPYKSGTYTMDQYTSGDTDVTDGKDYVKTLKYDDEMNFTYKYQVKSDANLDVITSPLLVGPSVDTVEVEFVNSSNQVDGWITGTAVWCNVTITDIGGSMVDGTNLWYRYTKPGTGNMSRWYHILDRPINESIFLYKALVFGEGDQNHIQWNATDVAGNGPTYSPMYNIKIDVSQITFLDGPPRRRNKVEHHGGGCPGHGHGRGGGGNQRLGREPVLAPGQVQVRDRRLDGLELHGHHRDGVQ
jgi:hypothetical protein